MSEDSKHRILIVDDQTSNIQALFEVLQDNYKLTAAKNGIKALELAHSDTPPDLILLDVMMPEMDGFEVCKNLKADPDTKNIPVIFVTSLDERTNEEEGLRAGAIDYIAKPIVPALVRERVKNHLQLHEYQQHLERRVTEETSKRIEQEKILIQQSKMAAMGEMLEAITHQWTQPLAAMSIMLQHIEQLHQENMLDDATMEKMVGSGIDRICFMSDTIKNFSQFFKPNRIKLRFTILDEVEKIIDILSPQLHRHEIQIHTEIPPNLSYVGYSNEFMQIILNILNNAKDALINNNTHRSNRNIWVTVNKTETDIEISISDNAGGIPASVLPTLFSERVTTKKEQGCGIGLMLCKTIIEEHHDGHISVRNNEKGAEFVIELPLAAS